MKTYTSETIARLLPLPAEDANKYSRGRLTLIAGSSRYPGAALLASVAGQRAGAGYTEAYVDEGSVWRLQMARPSLVVKAWEDWVPEEESSSTPERPRAYVVGSGFEADGSLEKGLVRRLLKKGTSPVLIDGGALRLITGEKVRGFCRRRVQKGLPTVLTPHGGEAATLAKAAGVSADDESDLSRELAQAYGACVVLKGPDTYISDGEGVYRMSLGSAALAKAGTGDVLAGIIGALLAQGLDAVDASVLGANLHALAGNLAARDLSPVSVCAEDVIEYLPKAILELMNR